MSPKGHNELLTAADVASVLKVSPRSVTRWASKGRIPAAVRTERVLRFRLEDVLRALAPTTRGESS
ncbi:helix-turn-helix domain-containing protein [Haloferula sp. A504]|uniref:helix-turn-helix domain-containing protein n=1 Tax=Haloferula sp. A504 TaxID=3373601 RepID=UPI0037AA15AC